MTGRLTMAEALNSDLRRIARIQQDVGLRPLVEYLPEIAAAFAVQFGRVVHQAGREPAGA